MMKIRSGCSGNHIFQGSLESLAFGKEREMFRCRKKKMKEALFFDPFKKMFREYLVSRYAFDGRIFLFIFFLEDKPLSSCLEFKR
jgi:hypothetical protein